jgi:pseudaminic acid biosynthesis-associated methylase
MKTDQMEFWGGQFGSQYTDRNIYSVPLLDEFYFSTYGISRTEMNQRFLQGLQIENILEMGCNVGNQLRALQSSGYSNLFGIELQQYAVEKAKILSKGINIIQGSLFDTPLKDGYFDLVFTSGVLIHISPVDIKLAMDEIYRLSKRYIWGFEYFSEEYEEIEYRGNKNKMWKGNFSKMLLERFHNLRMVREEKFKYINSDNIDFMFLLEKND